ncbi:hypothetical protein [Devosia indica]
MPKLLEPLVLFQRWRRRRCERQALAAGRWLVSRLTLSHDRARIFSSCYHAGFIWWFMKETAAAPGSYGLSDDDTAFAADQAMDRLAKERLNALEGDTMPHHPTAPCLHCSGSKSDAISLIYMIRGLDQEGMPSAKDSGEFLLDAIRHIRVKFASTLMSFSPWFWALAAI